ncbi:MAG: hypothetical protein ACFFAY_00700 [Promethearchaeota archaeon]
MRGRLEAITLISLLSLVMVCFAGLITADAALQDTIFHYESDLVGSEDSEFKVIIEEVEACNITVDFVNDPAFLFSLDLEFYSPVTEGDDFTVFHVTEPYVLIDELAVNYYLDETRNPWDKGYVRVKHLNLVLGTSVSYSIVIKCRNAKSWVTYSNNALLDDNTFFLYNDYYYEQEPDTALHFSLEPDANYSSSTSQFSIPRSDYLYFSALMPEVVGGEVNFGWSSGDEANILVNGWNEVTYGWYQRSGNPEIDLTAFAHHINANLSVYVPPTTSTTTTTTTTTSTDTSTTTSTSSTTSSTEDFQLLSPEILLAIALVPSVLIIVVVLLKAKSR